MIGHEYRRSDLLRGERIPAAVLAALPKTDLHCHLDGSLRLDTFRELGAAAGLEMPADEAEVRSRYFPDDRELSQQEFLRYFDFTLAAMQTAGNLRRVARELVEDAAAVGCWYLEVRFCPLLHREGGLECDAVVEAVAAGLREGEQGTGIRTGMIITGLRTISPDLSLEMARLAVRWKRRGVVAFDLAGTEEAYPAKRHHEAFYHVMNNNLDVTIHAGEGFGPESIHQALHRCGANRIGHGTRLQEDPDLLAYVNDHRIPLEICLTSNVQTGVIPELALHPFRHYHDLGVRVTLNTDNTLFARTSILREVELAVRTFDLTLLETENLILNGFKSAFLPARDKASLISRALERFAAIRDEHGLDGMPLA